MPELPDVEAFRRYLDATALHKTISAVKVRDAGLLRGHSARAFTRRLKGRRMEETRRRGKHLLVRLDDGAWLTLHFGMTGELVYFKHLKDDPPYDQVRIDFENGYHLAYVSRRRLGEIGLVADAEQFIARKHLGPDALDPDFDEEAFKAAFAKKRGALKTALMDQSLIAGIGNEYSDEILFQARLHPKTKTQALNDDQRTALYRKMRAVLQTAVDRGAGGEDALKKLPRSFLLPRRREGAPCPRCKGTVQSLKIAGRTAYYCPRCQKKP